MNAPTPRIAAAAPVVPAAPDPAAVPAGRRADGWTADRRRAFLAAIADGATVEAACARVGLSVASAYALRRRANGAAFAAGWAAACLVARDRIADILLARALEGQTDTYVRADGSIVTRHRHDNRLAMAMLARLDRLAEADGPAAADPGAAPAQTIAGAFDAFLDVVAQDAADATAVAAFVAAHAPQLPQLRDADADDAEPDDEEAEADADDDEPVWFDADADCYLTHFPPPPGFRGDEYGEYGDEDYARELTREELAAHCAMVEADTARRRVEEGSARDAWFACAPRADTAPVDGGSAEERPAGEGPADAPRTDPSLPVAAQEPDRPSVFAWLEAYAADYEARAARAARAAGR